MTALTTSDRVYQVTEARQVTGAAAEPDAARDAIAATDTGVGAAEEPADLPESELEPLPEPGDEPGPDDQWPVEELPDEDAPNPRFTLGQWLILGILLVLNAVVILIAVLALMGQLAI